MLGVLQVAYEASRCGASAETLALSWGPQGRALEVHWQQEVLAELEKDTDELHFKAALEGVFKAMKWS